MSTLCTCPPRRVVVALSGASGVVYGVRTAEALRNLGLLEAVLYTQAADRVSRVELGAGLREILRGLGAPLYGDEDYTAPYMSSSRAPDAMVIAPCSVDMAAMLAQGLQGGLVARAARAVLRLRRRLVLVVRETPLGVAELENLLRLAREGAVVLPASPGFYSRPRSVDDIIDFVVGKVLDALCLENNMYRRWEGYTSSSK